MKGSRREGGTTEEGSRGIFYGLLALVGVGGVAALLLLGGGGPEPIGPLSQAELDVAPDSTAFAVAYGPEDAPVTVIEFADYTCSHCANFAALPGPALRRDYAESGRVRMLFYDFPLSPSTNAIPAALAARCAGAQGRYGTMHDLLFARQSRWAGDPSPEDRFADYAREIGLDGEAFDACYSERRYLREILASRRFGEQKRVTGTPTILVEGEPTRGYGYGAVQAVIEEKLRAAGAARAAGSGSGGSDVSAGGGSGESGDGGPTGG